MIRLKDKVTHLENSLRINDLPVEVRHFVIEGTPEERERKQAEIKDSLIRKYGETASSKAIFVHLVSTQEFVDKLSQSSKEHQSMQSEDQTGY